MRSAIRRGDLDGASFRFEVGDEDWDGDVRTVQTVKALRDVTLATYPAYPAASVELRTKPIDQKEETTMDKEATKEQEVEEAVVDEPDLEKRTKGGLRVAERANGGAESRTLYGQFQRAGFEPGGRRTEIAWNDYEAASESRALTWTGSVDLVNRLDRAAGPFGWDQRYAWPAFPRVPVDSGVTSVNVADHLVARADGGRNVRSNYRAAHRSCNSRAARARP
jgi:hypothetical protein